MYRLPINSALARHLSPATFASKLQTPTRHSLSALATKQLVIAGGGRCDTVVKNQRIQLSLSAPQLDDPIVPSSAVSLVQQRAPDFCLKAVMPSDQSFKDVKLSDFGGRYLVIFFYPLDFTFVCPTELIAFSDRFDEFKSANCDVIGVSTDSHFSHLAWIQMSRKQGGLGGSLAYPLLADYKKEMARAYGVLVEQLGLALRGLFIIDPKGIVRQSTVNDLPVGRSVDEVLRLVKAFQFVDKHGEVCPANWKTGEKTINPANAKDYFNSANN